MMAKPFHVAQKQVSVARDSIAALWDFFTRCFFITRNVPNPYKNIIFSSCNHQATNLKLQKVKGYLSGGGSGCPI